MTFQEYQAELAKKQNSVLHNSLVTVVRTINFSPEESKKKLDDLLQCVKRLDVGFGKPRDGVPGVTEADFEPLKERLFSCLNEMIGNYDLPDELFAKSETQTAMANVFSALGLGNRKFDVPGFTIDRTEQISQPFQRPNASQRRTANVDKARQAMARDPLRYAAQFMALSDYGKEASPKELFISLGNVSAFKNYRPLQLLAEDKTAMGYLAEGAFQNYVDSYRAKQREVEENSRSFKEYSDLFAEDYRKGKIKYTELETRMQALRACTAGVKPEQRDSVRVYWGDFEKELETQRKQRSAGTVSAEEYQRQLAEGFKMPFEEQAERIAEVYGAEPVFHPEFADGERKGYDRESFFGSLPKADLSGVLVGGQPLTSEEFASLASLAAYDPEIGGVHLEGENGLIDIPANEDVSIYYHDRRTACFGNTPMEAAGGSILGPNRYAGLFISSEVKPAREKVIRALEDYRNGDSTTLARIIADGIRNGAGLAPHGTEKRGPDPRITADRASPIHVLPLRSASAGERMLQGALKLLERDKELSDAVRAFGVTEKMQQEATGFQLGRQILKAGEAAMEKLLEAAQGGQQLSSFEKNQCALAVLRRNMLMQSLRAHEETTEQDPRIKKIDQIAEREKEKVKQDFSDPSKMDEALKELQLIEARRGRKTLEICGTPSIYLSLRREGASALDRMAAEMGWDPDRLQKLSAFELTGELGIADRQAVKTTAQDIYNELTKDYKAGKMKYVLYEARLRAMRELTDGRKQAKIDLKTIDEAVEYKLQKNREREEQSRDAVETAIAKQMEDTYGGKLGTRLRGIYDVYGLTPTMNEPSILHGGYDEKTFSTLKAVQEKEGENHLRLDGGKVLSQEDFAAISIAVTQTDPKIGGVYMFFNQDTNETKNVIQKPGIEEAIGLRTLYVTDAYQSADGARKGFGSYIPTVVNPSRERAEKALRDYRGGAGSPAELGRIIGTGLKNLMGSSSLVGAAAQDYNLDYILEGAISGRLAVLAEKDPKLKTEVLKYTNQETLDTAKGLRTVYDITRASQAAMEKLKTSAEMKTPLSETERKTCIELVLREKALTASAIRQAKLKEAENPYKAKPMDRSTTEKAAIAAVMALNDMDRSVGLPDYVRTLGHEGIGFARKLLDQAMPNREAFFQKSDKEIVEALGAQFGSKDDPFQNKEYLRTYREDEELNKALHSRQIKAPVSGPGIKEH